MFDPESTLFQTDWRPLEDYMRRRGEETGLGYAYVETLSLEELDEEAVKAAGEIAYAAGRCISEIYKEFIDE